jgi:hypothetical protein
MVEIQVGKSWIVTARPAFWDENCDGVVTVTGKKSMNLNCYMFPIGWRSVDIDRSELPQQVKAACKKAMRSLPLWTFA